MSNIWEERYKELTDMWGIEPEWTLVQYQELINKGKVLDLGIGEGRNVARFALDGYTVDGVDISETALDRCGKMLSEVGCEHHLYNEPIQDFSIETDKYSLIISTWTLHFMKKSEVFKVIEQMKAGLVSGGVIYIGVFSKEDPKYKKLKATQEEVENDTFYIERFNSHACFF